MEENIIQNVLPRNQTKKADPKPINPIRYWKTQQISKNPLLTLTGYSRSADKTFFMIPEMKLGLDAGLVHGKQSEITFLTHTHIDHSKDIAYVCQRDGCKVYCPFESVGYVDNMVKVEISLNNCKEFNPEKGPKYTLIGVRGGDTFFIGNDHFRVKVVDCIHSVPCVGFCVEERRSKLKNEYKGLSGKEIGKLRNQGVEISEESFTPLFAYLGDTHIDIFQKNEFLFNYPTIIVECTFIHDEEGILERTKRDGHIHWSQLQEHVLAHPEVTFILIHWSLRYKEQEIYDFFDGLVNREENPLVLDNIVIFAGDTIAI